MPKMGVGVLPPYALHDATHDSTMSGYQNGRAKSGTRHERIGRRRPFSSWREFRSCQFDSRGGVPTVPFRGTLRRVAGVLTRPEHLPPGQTVEDALGFVRYLASQSHLQEIHFLWRPFLPTPTTTWCLNWRSPPVAVI